MLAARDQQRGGPGYHDRDGHRRDAGCRPGMAPDLVPPARPGQNDRLRETRSAERTRAMCHAHPVGAPGRGVVRALLEHPLAQAGGRTDLRHRGSRGRLHGPGLAQAFVPRDRIQPGAQLVRIAEALQLGGGDDEGVRHGAGGLGRRAGVGQHEPAVGVQRRRVTVVGPGEPVRVTCDDGRDQLTVLHADNRSWPPRGGERERDNRIAEKRTRDSYGAEGAQLDQCAATAPNPQNPIKPHQAPVGDGLSCTRRPGRGGAGDPRCRARAGPGDGTGSRTARWCPPRSRT